jgi:aminopeptidase N
LSLLKNNTNTHFDFFRGMVTYRENALIYDENPDDSSHVQKFNGVTVIAHELAHQFFGDLVTCEWWDQIWLNEGFATLFEYEITEIIQPTWKVRNFFNTIEMIRTLKIDSADDIRPMTHQVETLQEISDVFDFIAYGKCKDLINNLLIKFTI